MAGRPKLLVSKEMRYHTQTTISNITELYTYYFILLTRCGHGIVERIVMSKRKANTDLSSRMTKQHNTSTDYVFYTSEFKKKLKIVSPTKVGKRPIYKFFFEVEGQYCPLGCMLDVGSTCFLISPEAAKAFRVPVVKRKFPTSASDVVGRKIKNEGIFTIPLALAFSNHRTLEVIDHAFNVMKTSEDYDA